MKGHQNFLGEIAVEFFLFIIGASFDRDGVEEPCSITKAGGRRRQANVVRFFVRTEGS